MLQTFWGLGSTIEDCKHSITFFRGGGEEFFWGKEISLGAITFSVFSNIPKKIFRLRRAKNPWKSLGGEWGGKTFAPNRPPPPPKKK